jgi:hypothetical protein
MIFARNDQNNQLWHLLSAKFNETQYFVPFLPNIELSVFLTDLRLSTISI